MTQPRLISWAGDLPYRYSGQTLPALPWPNSLLPVLKRVIEKVSTNASPRFNHVLLNLYRDGRDSMGFHKDNEPELGDCPVVASLSLGASRRFVVVADKAAFREEVPATRELILESGSLLVMGGAIQNEFRHGLPKDAAVKTPRLNLTFRAITKACAE